MGRGWLVFSLLFRLLRCFNIIGFVWDWRGMVEVVKLRNEFWDFVYSRMFKEVMN